MTLSEWIKLSRAGINVLGSGSTDSETNGIPVVRSWNKSTFRLFYFDKYSYADLANLLFVDSFLTPPDNNV